MLTQCTVIGEHKEYLRFDSIVDTKEMVVNAYDQFTLEFLNRLNTLGLSYHNIKLMIGIPIMLLKNLDQDEGM